MKLVKPPPSAPMGAAEDMSAASRNAISIPSSAPIAAEAATTAANAVTMMKRGPIFTDTHFLSRSALLMTKGYFHPLTSHG